MILSKQSTLGNTPVFRNVTYRLLGSWIVVGLVGGVLFKTAVFRWNIPAILAYVALVSIVLGSTPTHRGLMSNLYGILFKKPQKGVLSQMATTTTMGYSIREVVEEPDLDIVAFKLNTGMYALVYNITSDINYWSDTDDYIRQASGIKSLFNVFEGGEAFMVIMKNDSDTGMLALEQTLEEKDVILGDDYQAMSDRRRSLLHTAATSSVSRSIQQYGVLIVKPKNVKRTKAQLERSTRTMRAASHPGDILLSAMGFEGGVD